MAALERPRIFEWPTRSPGEDARSSSVPIPGSAARDLDGVERVMTQRSPGNPRTAFLAVCLGALAIYPSWTDEVEASTTDTPGAVTVEGIVTYDGPLPRPISVAEAATRRHLVEVDPAAAGPKDAVLGLEGIPAGRQRPARD